MGLIRKNKIKQIIKELHKPTDYMANGYKTQYNTGWNDGLKELKNKLKIKD